VIVTVNGGSSYAISASQGGFFVERAMRCRRGSLPISANPLARLATTCRPLTLNRLSLCQKLKFGTAQDDRIFAENG